MADLFTLFDGSMGAAGSAAVSRQSSDSFSGVSSENDLVATLASGSDQVVLLIDYSDFSNFVTFNSAESYVTVTADQILNSYPRDGSADDIQVFLNSIDGYQRHFLSLWPSRTGHLRIDRAVSSSYVRIDDFGVQDGVARTSFVSPGTGSVSIQGWIDTPALTGTNDASFVFQKVRSNGVDGLSVYVSGSSLFFTVTSGSASATASGTLTEMPMFFAAVLDRSSITGSVLVYTATTGSYPALASTDSLTLGPRYDLASGSFFIASGSLSSKSTVPFSGSIDAVSVWSTARTLVDMSGTYNRRIHAQSGLVGLWDFNDASAATPPSYSSIVRDGSGHRLDGRIQLFHSGVLGSGSLIFDSPDPILSLDDPDVVSYVVGAQLSGALYDRNNQSLIFRLFPEAFSQADPTSNEVFRNFALILARHFDLIKTYVNQLANLRRVHYGDFDQAPDGILTEVARSFGWELGGGFATTDALRFFIGRGIHPGPQGNDSTVLSDVRSAFWRRVLLNLMYLYKTKGTRESVEALLRVYGVDSGFVRLKEYARKSEGTIPLSRVLAEKSVNALRFDGGGTVFCDIVNRIPPVPLPWTIDHNAIGVPATAGEWSFVMTAAGVPSSSPSVLWKLQESAGTLADSIGTFTGVVTGSVTYAVDVPVWDRNGVFTSKGVVGIIANESALLPNISTNSTMVILYAKYPSVVVATRTIMKIGVGFGTDTAAELITSGKIQLSVNGVLTTSSAAFLTGGVSIVILQVDRTNGFSRLYTEAEVLEHAVGGSGRAIWLGGNNFFSWFPDDVVYMYMTAFFNSNAELSRAQVSTLMTTLGWSPTWTP